MQYLENPYTKNKGCHLYSSLFIILILEYTPVWNMKDTRSVFANIEQTNSE